MLIKLGPKSIDNVFSYRNNFCWPTISNLLQIDMILAPKAKILQKTDCLSIRNTYQMIFRLTTFSSMAIGNILAIRLHILIEQPIFIKFTILFSSCNLIQSDTKRLTMFSPLANAKKCWCPWQMWQSFRITHFDMIDWGGLFVRI